MAKLYSSYIREIHKQTGYMAIWPPDVHLELGTVLKRDKSQCVVFSSLASFGIDFEESLDPTPANWEYQSKGGVDITFKASGEAAPAGWAPVSGIEAGCQVLFHRGNSIVAVLTDAYQHRIKDLLAVQASIATLPEGKWDSDFLVVTALRKADSATILMGSDANSRIEISAEATIGGLSDLADPKAKLSIVHKSQLQNSFLAAEGMTPFFHAMRLKGGSLAPAKRLVAMANDYSDLFEEVSPDIVLG